MATKNAEMFIKKIESLQFNKEQLSFLLMLFDVLGTGKKNSDTKYNEGKRDGVQKCIKIMNKVNPNSKLVTLFKEELK